MKKERIFALDVIRVIAVFLVISVHFFMNINYYNLVKIIGLDKYLLDIIRVISLSCVPMFLILTGYLQSNKKISKKYYFGKSILSIYMVYVIISIVTLIFKNIYLHKSISFFTGIKQILNFTAANYSWYIEMYLGLYLLIPFLNILWKNLKNQTEKKILLLVLFICVILPSLTNSFNINQNLQWMFMGIPEQDKILPYWWYNLYPIVYYFIGCYIKDLNNMGGGLFKKNKIYLLIYFCLTVCIFSLFNYFKNYNMLLTPNLYSRNWYGIEPFVTSTFLFYILIQINYDKVPNFLKLIISKLSQISLGIYLISYIFDTIFYQILSKYIVAVQDKFIFYPLMVFSVFVSSAIASAIVYKIKDFIFAIFNFLKRKFIFTTLNKSQKI